MKTVAQSIKNTKAQLDASTKMLQEDIRTINAVHERVVDHREQQVEHMAQRWERFKEMHLEEREPPIWEQKALDQMICSDMWATMAVEERIEALQRLRRSWNISQGCT